MELLLIIIIYRVYSEDYLLNADIRHRPIIHIKSTALPHPPRLAYLEEQVASDGGVPASSLGKHIVFVGVPRLSFMRCC